MSTRSANSDLRKVILRLVNLKEEDTALAKALEHEGYIEVEDFLFMDEPEVIRWQFKDTSTDGSVILKDLPSKDRKAMQIFIRWVHNELIPANNGNMLTAADWASKTHDQFKEFRVKELAQMRSGVNPGTSTTANPPASNTSSQAKSSSSVDSFKRGIKRDIGTYPKFTDDKFWDNWHMMMEAQAKTHDLDDVLSPAFIPTTADEKALFQQKQNFMFAVLLQTVHTGAGRAIVKKHNATSDAQAAWKELVAHYTSSTTAKLRSDELMRFLTTAKLDETWKRSSTEFLRKWEEQMRLYEEITLAKDHFSSDVKRRLLENAVLPVKELQFVAINDNMNVTKGGTPLNFQQYFDALHEAAVLRDNSFAASSRNKKLYRINLHHLGLDDLYDGYASDDTPSEDDSNNESDYKALVSQRKPPDKEGGRDNLRDSKRLWIPEEMWNLLDDRAKAILTGRIKPPPRENRTANMHGIDLDSADEDQDNQIYGDQSPSIDPGSPNEDNVDNASDNKELLLHVTGRKPLPFNDIRRVLATSSKSYQDKKPNTRSAKTHEVTYTVSKHARVDKLYSLMDRGCNGGMAGSDVKWVKECGSGRSACVKGIGGHEIKNLPIGTVAGVLKTQLGPVVGIFHQYAYHGKGRTVHSCGQIEHFRNLVDDRSSQVGGMQRLVTKDGYVIPLEMCNGLVYLDMHPPSDDEYHNLPHVVLTSDEEWNPSILDNGSCGVTNLPRKISESDQTSNINGLRFSKPILWVLGVLFSCYLIKYMPSLDFHGFHPISGILNPKLQTSKVAGIPDKGEAFLPPDPFKEKVLHPLAPDKGEQRNSQEQKIYLDKGPITKLFKGIFDKKEPDTNPTMANVRKQGECQRVNKFRKKTKSREAYRANV